MSFFELPEANVFLLLFVMVYSVSVLVLLLCGLSITWLNSRHPERKIQKRQFTSRSLTDIRSSLKQLLVTSLCLSFGIFVQLKGWTLFEQFSLSYWSLPLFFVLSLILHDAWFYWGHRALHCRSLYKFHRPHHRNITPSVWSNDAGHAVDTFFAHSYYALIVLVLPIPTVVLLLHRLFDQVSAAIGHCGYEHFASPLARKPWPLLCTVFHDQHHQYFHYNYGNYFSIWDRICGTVHPQYDDLVKTLTAPRSTAVASELK